MQKLEKCEGGCVGYWDPIFLNETKNQETRCKKPFANWLRVSGWKFNVSDWHLKCGLGSCKAQRCAIWTQKYIRNTLLTSAKAEQ